MGMVISIKSKERTEAEEGGKAAGVWRGRSTRHLTDNFLAGTDKRARFDTRP